jgi:predicted dehydrogenase
MAHRIGIIGFGIMGERMLRHMRQHPNFRVVAAWDPAAEAGARLAAADAAARLGRDAADVAGDATVDCVYIASPPASHASYVDLAFDHGKAVLCEKPLGIDLATSERMVERVEREGRKAALNFPFASAPAARAIVSALSSRELGAIESVEIELAFAQWPRPWQENARWLSARTEGGFAREVLSHFLFLTQRLLGPLRLGRARILYPGEPGAAETKLSATLEAGGVPVTITGSVGGEVPDHNRWILRGRQGAFELHDWYRLRRRINGSWLDVDFGEGSLSAMSQRAQLEALSALLSGGAHRLASFREGLGVQECVEAMLRSGETG